MATETCRRSRWHVNALHAHSWAIVISSNPALERNRHAYCAHTCIMSATRSQRWEYDGGLDKTRRQRQRSAETAIKWDRGWLSRSVSGIGLANLPYSGHVQRECDTAALLLAATRGVTSGKVWQREREKARTKRLRAPGSHEHGSHSVHLQLHVPRPPVTRPSNRFVDVHSHPEHRPTLTPTRSHSP